MVLQRTLRKTTAMVTRVLLNTYLLSGIDELPAAWKRFWKLMSDGCETKKRGGKANSSSMGLKAWLMKYTMGRPMKMAMGTRYR